MENTAITIHEPGDYIFAMGKTGKLIAWQVQEDGTLDSIDPSTAVTLHQRRQANLRARGGIY